MKTNKIVEQNLSMAANPLLTAGARSFESEFISKLFTDLYIKKEQLIQERLEKLGLPKLIEADKKRRFKKMICEFHPTEEIWYYDNGTAEGERIITFKSFEPKYDFEKNTTIGMELEYY
jgi:hypothetical protein